MCRHLGCGCRLWESSIGQDLFPCHVKQDSSLNKEILYLGSAYISELVRPMQLEAEAVAFSLVLFLMHPCSILMVLPPRQLMLYPQQLLESGGFLLCKYIVSLTHFTKPFNFYKQFLIYLILNIYIKFTLNLFWLTCFRVNFVTYRESYIIRDVNWSLPLNKLCLYLWWLAINMYSSIIFDSL